MCYYSVGIVKNTFISVHHTRAYISYSVLQCGLKSRVVNITYNLCAIQGNVGLKSTTYNQEWFQIKSGKNEKIGRFRIQEWVFKM